MKTVSEYVQEAVDLMESGSYEFALVPTVAAIGETIRKTSGKEDLSEYDFQEFIKANWQLITFMGMPRALPLPLNIPFGVKRIVPTFNVHHGAEEIVLLVIAQILRTGRLPEEFAFNTAGEFEIKDGKLLLPDSLIYGLLGGVIFHPTNKDEITPDKYWLSVADFKMFISEFWGRQDLAERIMKFYLEREA
ncbi:MAG TPA: hypothetical protein VK892_12125 [Pyrinomonadaceae bacterium]|nr:hypothetical protein [Pyrinomonadaceae bacterium]